MLIFAEGGKPENPEKNPSPGIEPEFTVVRGECLAATPPMLPNGFFPIDQS
jgi:hypothetical protein